MVFASRVDWPLRISAWLLLSWFTLRLVRRVSRKYAAGAAFARSDFRRVQESLELQGDEPTDALEEGGVYRGAAAQPVSFNAVALDGRTFPLSAVKTLRLLKWRASTVALVMEIENERESVLYEVDTFARDDRSRAVALRDSLASACDAARGKSITLTTKESARRVSYRLDDCFLAFEGPVIAASALAVGAEHGGSVVLAAAAGLVVIIAVDLLRVGLLARRELLLRDAFAAAFREHARQGAPRS